MSNILNSKEIQADVLDNIVGGTGALSQSQINDFMIKSLGHTFREIKTGDIYTLSSYNQSTNIVKCTKNGVECSFDYITFMNEFDPV